MIPRTKICIYIVDLGNNKVNMVFVNKYGLMRELGEMRANEYINLLNKGSSLWGDYPGWDDVKEIKPPWKIRKLMPEFKI